jgi:hypothetical protein
VFIIYNSFTRGIGQFYATHDLKGFITKFRGKSRSSWFQKKPNVIIYEIIVLSPLCAYQTCLLYWWKIRDWGYFDLRKSDGRWRKLKIFIICALHQRLGLLWSLKWTSMLHKRKFWPVEWLLRKKDHVPWSYIFSRSIIPHTIKILHGKYEGSEY